MQSQKSSGINLFDMMLILYKLLDQESHHDPLNWGFDDEAPRKKNLRGASLIEFCLNQVEPDQFPISITDL
jgi:hypothetical protein